MADIEYYRPVPPPQNVEELARYLYDELNRIADMLANLEARITALEP